ncbi:hypothetical protein QUB63_08285 [Microcoleus sp. ARI1-B5]|uniref:hypothetical protein n=1 Tax=unclassified Microcoleus TaxID=2642155 RepID=UPI002FD668CB
MRKLVGIYEDFSKLDRDLEALIAADIPCHLFKIQTDNDDIDLKPVTPYFKAVRSGLECSAIVAFSKCDLPLFS